MKLYKFSYFKDVILINVININLYFYCNGVHKSCKNCNHHTVDECCELKFNILIKIF